MKTMVIAKLQKRAEAIDSWLKTEEGMHCKSVQAHPDKGTPERVYWHYGYMVALRDVMNLIRRDTAHLN